MNDAQIIISLLSNGELISLIQCMDRLDLPMSRRFEGDDEQIVKLMSTLDLKQTLVDKLLIGGLLMREALHRGLAIEHNRN